MATRRRRGRPTLDNAGRLVRVAVSITGPTVAELQELGDGNASLGLRKIMNERAEARAPKKMGRPTPDNHDDLRKYSIHLPEHIAGVVKEDFDGNLSYGLRVILEKYYSSR